MRVRDVRGTHLGTLITVRGIVTRVSEVKPLLLVNAYTCDSCGTEIFQDITHRQFTPLTDCLNPTTCMQDGRKGTLHMQTRACRFSPFQEVKLQEMVSRGREVSETYLEFVRPTKFQLVTFLVQ